MPHIEIITAGLSLPAELNASPTAQKVWAALPIEGQANRWGDEIYFRIPVVAELEPDARAEVAVGELGFWPQGSAFCIFFGPTLASTDERPRAYSPVNIIGRVLADARVLRSVSDGAPITLRRATQD